MSVPTLSLGAWKKLASLPSLSLRTQEIEGLASLIIVRIHQNELIFCFSCIHKYFVKIWALDRKPSPPQGAFFAHRCRKPPPPSSRAKKYCVSLFLVENAGRIFCWWLEPKTLASLHLAHVGWQQNVVLQTKTKSAPLKKTIWDQKPDLSDRVLYLL